MRFLFATLFTSDLRAFHSQRTAEPYVADPTTRLETQKAGLLSWATGRVRSMG